MKDTLKQVIMNLVNDKNDEASKALKQYMAQKTKEILTKQPIKESASIKDDALYSVKYESGGEMEMLGRFLKAALHDSKDIVSWEEVKETENNEAS